MFSFILDSSKTAAAVSGSSSGKVIAKTVAWFVGDVVKNTVLQVAMHYLLMLLWLPIKTTTYYIVPPTRRLTGARNTTHTKVFPVYHATLLAMSALLIASCFLQTREMEIAAYAIVVVTYGTIAMQLFSENEAKRMDNGEGLTDYWKTQYIVISAFGTITMTVSALLKLGFLAPLGGLIANTIRLFSGSTSGLFLLRGIVLQRVHAKRVKLEEDEKLLTLIALRVAEIALVGMLSGIFLNTIGRTCVSFICAVGFYGLYAVARYDPVEGTRKLPLKLSINDRLPREAVLTVGAFWLYAVSVLSTSMHVVSLFWADKDFALLAKPLSQGMGIVPILFIKHRENPPTFQVQSMISLDAIAAAMQFFCFLLGTFPVSRRLHFYQQQSAIFATAALLAVVWFHHGTYHRINGRRLPNLAVSFMSAIYTLMGTLTLLQLPHMESKEWTGVYEFSRRFAMEAILCGMWMLSTDAPVFKHWLWCWNWV